MNSMFTDITQALPYLDIDAEKDNTKTTKLTMAISMLEPHAAFMMENRQGKTMHFGKIAMLRPLFQESLMG